MLTRAENELLTRIGPGTAAGDLLRRYWQPAALSAELPVGAAPLPVRLLGEDLVLFRDADGQPGLLAVHCAHRGADLSYGRLEDGGLRCLYHGWLYDRHGRCLEQPGEPDGSTFHERVRQPAYPCRERAGVIFAYLGPGQAPLLPDYEFLAVPAENRFVTKLFSDCNYLQGNEGNQDPVHLSFLHWINTDEARASNQLQGRDRVPRIEAETTEWGVRIYAIRPEGTEARFVRITNAVLPNLTCFVGGPGDGHSVNWHVPIDDTHHWKYTFIFRRGGPLDQDATARGRAETDVAFRPIRNRGNRYLQDRQEQRTLTFAGMASAFQIHDLCVTEGAGEVQDRTIEHLGASDVGIIATRQRLLAALRDIEEGRDPPHVVREPAANRFPDLVTVGTVVPNRIDYRTFWKESAGPVETSPALTAS
jgi:phenylpropionate dioxygenase-like ring-hydroxylating dioxygenase large terminal subunit